ncbi:MAG: cell division protein FtsL [Marinibacterium sp.]|nr:cell division protein FtsL [Marinibacterium sp.]
MKSLFYILTAMTVLGLAFWAYHQNYSTKDVLDQTKTLQRQIGQEQGRLAVLRAEWAYLNRPDRLRELAEINFPRLGLLPFRADQFETVERVQYPGPVSPLEGEPGDLFVSSDGQWP